MAATLREVAATANVSITTVSFILNKRHQARAISRETRDRVLKVAKELAYSPNQMAKSLRTRKTMTIGILVGNWIDSNLGRIVEGITQQAAESGYRSILASVVEHDDPVDVAGNLLNASVVDAVVIVDRGMDFSREVIDAIASDRRPVTLVGKRLNDPPCPCVCDDYLNYGYESTRHFLAKGLRTIAYIGFDNESSAEFLIGAKKAHAKVQLQWKDTDFLEIPFAEHRQVRNKSREVLESAWPNKAAVPELLFFLNDQILYGALTLLKQLDVHIPEDTSIVGYGDMDMIYGVLSPHISTVLTAPAHLGAKVAEIVVSELKGKPMVSPNEIIALGGRVLCR